MGGVSSGLVLEGRLGDVDPLLFASIRVRVEVSDDSAVEVEGVEDRMKKIWLFFLGDVVGMMRGKD